MDISIKKGDVRKFLVWCAKIACASPEDYEFYLKEKILDGVLWEKNFEFNEELSIHQIIGHYEDQVESLVCNIKTMATLLTGKKDFVFEFNETTAWSAQDGNKHTLTAGEVTVPFEIPYRKGNVRYLEGKFGNIDPKGNYPKKVITECIADGELTKLFLEALVAYRKSKGIDYFQIPLKICEWCNNPFFWKQL